MMEYSLAKAIFRLIKPLKLIRSWFPERSTTFYLVLLRENSPVAIIWVSGPAIARIAD